MCSNKILKYVQNVNAIQYLLNFPRFSVNKGGLHLSWFKKTMYFDLVHLASHVSCSADIIRVFILQGRTIKNDPTLGKAVAVFPITKFRDPGNHGVTV